MIPDALKKKLAGTGGQAGETLVETLVALTIAGLAIIMLAMAISVSSRLVAQGADTAKTYYAENNKLVKVEGGSGSSAKVKVEVNGLTNTSDASSEVDVAYDVYENAPGGGDVVAYKAKG